MSNSGGGVAGGSCMTSMMFTAMLIMLIIYSNKYSEAVSYNKQYTPLSATVTGRDKYLECVVCNTSTTCEPGYGLLLTVNYAFGNAGVNLTLSECMTMGQVNSFYQTNYRVNSTADLFCKPITPPYNYECVDALQDYKDYETITIVLTVVLGCAMIMGIITCCCSKREEQNGYRGF